MVHGFDSRWKLFFTLRKNALKPLILLEERRNSEWCNFSKKSRGMMRGMIGDLSSVFLKKICEI